ncbi:MULTISPECIES: DUF1294 domain-containing protein [Alteribacter]|uniref:DUF1294 domain-containing protein n=1 Tax=Alteribacter keqinensis TaxID=2483800 RepID=A0A3M7TXJ2_9BACI|nr:MULTISPECIES: DUF1294 domain-containing protein [Alteribacter]MBM7096495.1 DUF1294 domain-containing protein [Alteribacter salitolerans]RNA70296.1 DUF1294 domain-containing protein [Alteribacter keqinensis]
MVQGVIMYFLCYYGIINVLAFVVMWNDKRKAQKQVRRTSEQSLITWAAFGGAFGMLFASKTFRHKTRKKTFSIGLPFLCLLHIALFALLVWLAGSMYG